MSLELAHPTSNHVLVKLDPNDRIMLDNGQVLFLAPENKQQAREENRPIRGTVIDVPDKLTFVQGNRSLMPWKTNMELQVGDKLIMKRNAVTVATDKELGSYFVDGEDIYIYIKYHECVMAIRGTEAIILNGMVIVEPDSVGYITELIVPENAKKISRSFGTIRYIGLPNQEYHKSKNSKYEDVIPNDDVYWARKENGEMKIDLVDLQVGDRIQFKESTAIPLEPGLIKHFKDVPLYRMQRTNILAKL